MDLFERQALLIPDGMKRTTAVIVGQGMLGSWLSHSLARTMRGVIAYDMDTVGPENLGTQAFTASDVTMNKAKAMLMHMQGLPYYAVPERFDNDLSRVPNGGRVVVSAVDSFEGRRAVAKAAFEASASYFIDTRAAGTVGVVVFCTPSDIEAYLATLESDEDAPPPACGAEGTAFVGLWVAAQVTSSIVRAFRGLPVPYKVVHDVGMDLRVMTQASVEEVMLSQ